MSLTISAPVRFILVGSLVTVIDVGVTYFMVLLTGTRVMAVTIGFVAGLIASYLLHAKVTFSSTLDPFTQVPRFLLLVAINYLETIGIVLLLTGLFGISTMGGKIITLPFVAATSYFFSRHFVYADGHPTH
jgi:putative flippase GtrA